MERSRVTLFTLFSVLISSISGTVVELRVKPGDDITIYGECEWKAHDLLVENITESDLGLYYCVLHETKVCKGTDDGDRLQLDCYHHGNRTTFLSLLDCSLCWKLLVSVCPVGVLLSSVISSTCVYCICTSSNKADRKADQRGNINTRKHNEVGEDDVCYASLDVPSSGKKQLKKKTAESSDLCIYSEVKAGRK
ncbi:hypothetical protein MHYP_G00250220 [Metynnis hypsauchen]